MARTLLVALSAVALAGCVEAVTEVDLAPDGSAVVEIVLEIEREAWDLWDDEMRASLMCEAPRDGAIAEGVEISTRQATSTEVRTCTYRVALAAGAQPPSSFPVAIEPVADDQARVVVNMAGFTGEGTQPMTDIVRASLAGKSWRVDVAGPIVSSTGTIAEDRSSASAVYPMVDVLERRGYLIFEAVVDLDGEA